MELLPNEQVWLEDSMLHTSVLSNLHDQSRAQHQREKCRGSTNKKPWLRPLRREEDAPHARW
jgi:hypothetical protein